MPPQELTTNVTNLPSNIFPLGLQIDVSTDLDSVGMSKNFMVQLLQRLIKVGEFNCVSGDSLGSTYLRHSQA